MPLHFRHIKLTVLFILKKTGVFTLAHFVNRKQVTILGYHGGSVFNEHQYNAKLFMPRKTFAERMETLSSLGYQVITLDDAVNNKPSRPPNSVVITFDDGWMSTYTELLPELAARKLPSTLFLSTKDYSSGSISINAPVRYALQLLGHRMPSPKFWLGHDLVDIRDKPKKIEALIDDMEELIAGHENRQSRTIELLEELTDILGVSRELPIEHMTAFSFMGKEEVKSAARSGCQIEAHGHIHRYPRGNPDQLRADLTICSDLISEATGRRPRHYCFPSGKYDDCGWSVFHEMGIISAATCESGQIEQVDEKNRYSLPRFLDGTDVHVLEFEAELCGILGSMRKLIRPKPSNSV
jgi:peptidoglycan/xylan/chitin deacetylase (PgdA/CDA1 family)